MRILFICFLLLAAAMASFGLEDDPAQVGAEAASAPLDRQPELYLRAAQLQLKSVDTLYNQGKTEEASNALRQLTEFADKATDTAVRSGKRLKGAEIEIRKIASRLSDIQHSLSFEDQAPVKAAAEHLETLRTRLLDRMFSKDKKK